METCHASGRYSESGEYTAHKNVCSQGLDGGMITQQDIDVGLIPRKTEKLTVRDATVYATVVNFMERGFGVIALQECSKIFLIRLEAPMREFRYEKAVPGWGCMTPDAILIYNMDVLRASKARILHPFARQSSGKGKQIAGKPIIEATFEAINGPPMESSLVTVIAGKVKGTPSREGVFAPDLAPYAQFIADPAHGYATRRLVMMGDYNFLEEDVIQKLQAAGGAAAEVLPAAGDARYATNVNPRFSNDRMDQDGIPSGFGGGPFAPKRIDHIFHLNGDCNMNATCTLLLPEEVLPGLDHMVEILQTGNAVASPGRLPVWELFAAGMPAEEVLATAKAILAVATQPPNESKNHTKEKQKEKFPPDAREKHIAESIKRSLDKMANPEVYFVKGECGRTEFLELLLDAVKADANFTKDVDLKFLQGRVRKRVGSLYGIYKKG